MLSTLQGDQVKLNQVLLELRYQAGKSELLMKTFTRFPEVLLDFLLLEGLLAVPIGMS